MKKLFKIIFVLLMIQCLLIGTALARDTLQKIERTGKLDVGFREGSIPFAFMDPKVGHHVGFSVDMTHFMAELLSDRFGKKIVIVPHGVTTKTRIPLVANGTVDCEMGSTTYTVKREETVDFSFPFFFSEATFMVEAKSGIQVLEDLNGKILSATRSGTNLTAIEKLSKEGVIKPKDILVVETHPQGILALANGKIDAYCTDRSLLEGMRLKDKNPEKWKVLDFAIGYEPYGYILPENDSNFRDFVNATLIWSIKTGKFFELYEKWMGPEGPVPIPMSQDYRKYLEMITLPIEDGWWKK